MRLFRPLAAGLTLLSLATPVAAQDLSDAELLQLFINQRDAFRAAQQPGTGQTRGLTLVTVDDLQVSTDSPALAAPETGGEALTSLGDGGGTVSIGLQPSGLDAPAADTVAVAETAAPATVFGKLDPGLQVNVHISFAFDSAALADDQKPQLVQLCNVMKGSDIQLFRIVGHTDAAGSDAYNEKLSMLRAQEVQRYFVNDCGIDKARLEAIGLGERFLANEADPRSGENRRVEFQALS